MTDRHPKMVNVPLKRILLLDVSPTASHAVMYKVPVMFPENVIVVSMRCTTTGRRLG